MTQEKSGNFALKLSVEVLKREIGFDEGLVRAQTNNSVGAFIEGLNILVGRELFDLKNAQARLRSGVAERAAEGHGDPFELPPELEGWTLDTEESRPPHDEKNFIPLEGQAEKYASDIDELKSRIQLIEKYMGEDEALSNPWIAPALLLALTLIGTLVAQFVIHSIVGALIVLSVGTMISLSVFQKEVKRYESEVRRIHMEAKRRADAKDKLVKELGECNLRIQSLREKAEKILERSGAPPDEGINEFRSRYPNLFPSN